ncbi:sulfurtransferase [Solirubrobacter soli]|uniref:sulfurtransferase n=1 Tax=Solirubrobacter soli TaxID=363832 RepID=UPI00040234B0|nr:sulfurtransferase [Solirubrobacter soli]
MIDPVVSEIPEGAVVADVRSYLDGRVGRDAYDAGHIPGAVFVDLGEALAAHLDPALGGRHPLPTPEHFAAAMAEVGIGDEDTVIAYDDAGGVMAARLVWMLRATGRQGALLDGGIQAWDGPLETDTPQRTRARFSARPWPEAALASIDEAADTGTHVVIDARQRDRFHGAADDLDPRFGHIPGAQSLPCRENLDEAGRFLPKATLREKFAEVGITGSEPVISYCGSGVTACHNLIALEHAGLGGGRLFPGSWSLWSRDPARPLET